MAITETVSMYERSYPQSMLRKHNTVKYRAETRSNYAGALHEPLRVNRKGAHSVPNMMSLEYYAYPVKFMLDRYLHPQHIDRLTGIIVEVYRSAHRRLYDDSVYNRTYGARDRS
jgi:hypothetical protein